jgi:hypothetical protein
MSKQNTLLSTWVAQIRKVTGANEKYHFICISQELERIDISVRDLASEIVVCEKGQLYPTNTAILQNGRRVQGQVKDTYIRLTWFVRAQCTKRYESYRDYRTRTYDFRSVFYGNQYMQYYDSYDLIDFGNEVYV